MRDFLLKRQLRGQAVGRQEADDLAALARSLRQTPLPDLSQSAKDVIAEQLGLHPRRYRAARRLGLATSFAVLAFLVMAVQTATPGSPLYNIKSTVSKFMPWSNQPPAPSQPLAPSEGHPLQLLPTQPTSPSDNMKVNLPLQGGDSLDNSAADTLQSEAPSLQLPGLDDVSHENLPDEFHDLIVQPAPGKKW